MPPFTRTPASTALLRTLSYSGDLTVKARQPWDENVRLQALIRRQIEGSREAMDGMPQAKFADRLEVSCYRSQLAEFEQRRGHWEARLGVLQPTIFQARGSELRAACGQELDDIRDAQAILFHLLYEATEKIFPSETPRDLQVRVTPLRWGFRAESELSDPDEGVWFANRLQSILQGDFWGRPQWLAIYLGEPVAFVEQLLRGQAWGEVLELLPRFQRLLYQGPRSFVPDRRSPEDVARSLGKWRRFSSWSSLGQKAAVDVFLEHPEWKTPDQHESALDILQFALRFFSCVQTSDPERVRDWRATADALPNWPLPDEDSFALYEDLRWRRLRRIPLEPEEKREWIVDWVVERLAENFAWDARDEALGRLRRDYVARFLIPAGVPGALKELPTFFREWMLRGDAQEAAAAFVRGLFEDPHLADARRELLPQLKLRAGAANDWETAVPALLRDYLFEYVVTLLLRWFPQQFLSRAGIAAARALVQRYFSETAATLAGLISRAQVESAIGEEAGERWSVRDRSEFWGLLSKTGPGWDLSNLSRVRRYLLQIHFEGMRPLLFARMRLGNAQERENKEALCLTPWLDLEELEKRGARVDAALFQRRRSQWKAVYDSWYFSSPELSQASEALFREIFYDVHGWGKPVLKADAEPRDQFRGALAEALFVKMGDEHYELSPGLLRYLREGREAVDDQGMLEGRWFEQVLRIDLFDTFIKGKFPKERIRHYASLLRREIDAIDALLEQRTPLTLPLRRPKSLFEFARLARRMIDLSNEGRSGAGLDKASVLPILPIFDGTWTSVESELRRGLCLKLNREQRIALVHRARGWVPTDDLLGFARKLWAEQGLGFLTGGVRDSLGEVPLILDWLDFGEEIVGADGTVQGHRYEEFLERDVRRFLEVLMRYTGGGVARRKELQASTVRLIQRELRRLGHGKDALGELRAKVASFGVALPVSYSESQNSDRLRAQVFVSRLFHTVAALREGTIDVSEALQEECWLLAQDLPQDLSLESLQDLKARFLAIVTSHIPESKVCKKIDAIFLRAGAQAIFDLYGWGAAPDLELGEFGDFRQTVRLVLASRDDGHLGRLTVGFFEERFPSQDFAALELAVNLYLAQGIASIAADGTIGGIPYVKALALLHALIVEASRDFGKGDSSLSLLEEGRRIERRLASLIPSPSV